MARDGIVHHTEPPIGAKGLNLAVRDVWELDRSLGALFATGSEAGLGSYLATALNQVWRTQHFSWLMTLMLHRADDASDFDGCRRLAELELVTTSIPAATSLAQNYVGLPPSH